MKKKTIIWVLIIAILVVVGGIIMINLIQKGSWEKQELIKYKMNSSGDKKGGTEEIALALGEEGVILTISSAKWHDEEPTVEEYLVDGKALEEIKDIFIKNGMYKWDGKKFSDMFVADGKTTSYLFIFTDDDVSFSSQIYPEPYAGVLKEIDAIVERYKNSGKKPR